MLGRGRPFVLELIDPKNLDVDLAAVEAEINRRNEGRLEIQGLHWTEKGRVRTLKETPHAKLYGALVEIGGELDRARLAGVLGKRLTVVQQTPARVAHRRAEKARERWISFEDLEPVDGPGEPGEPGRVRLRVRAEHGTYVKEAIDGESGQTEPSLSSLVGVPCRCLELDVLEILDEVGREEPVRQAPRSFGAGV
jgi:tRNA pseudouridine synthase 10